MDLDGGGWQMVWKHAYYQTGNTPLQQMTTFSDVDRPCIDDLPGW